MLRNKQTRSKTLWLFADLLMVFLGVYGAFALDNYREVQQKNQQKEIIINALHAEFSDSQKYLSEGIPRFNY